MVVNIRKKRINYIPALRKSGSSKSKSKFNDTELLETDRYKQEAWDQIEHNLKKLDDSKISSKQSNTATKKRSVLNTNAKVNGVYFIFLKILRKTQ
ncbi:hypothetical protein [Weissella cibaria]|uniref:hypothetical protein n=1 Tax=Weissella cibaria TaxID=137591 RepID=UPI0031B60924